MPSGPMSAPEPGTSRAKPFAMNGSNTVRKDAGFAAKLTAGDIKYTPTDGTPSLKKAVIRYTEENYDLVVAPENVYYLAEIA
jgi:aspartate/methionine/tyrosine aminotransferase